MQRLLTLRGTMRNRLLGTRLVRAVNDGTATKAAYAAYLQDVYRYACHSSQVIGVAGSRCALTHPKASAYLFHHAQEELGHDEWAFADLKELGRTDDEIRSTRASGPCMHMLGIEYYYAYHGNPVALFGWMYVLECLGGDLGGALGTKLNSTLGLQGKALRFVVGHGEADTDHSKDLTDTIRDHLPSRPDYDEICYVADLAADLYIGILDSAAEHTT